MRNTSTRRENIDKLTKTGPERFAQKGGTKQHLTHATEGFSLHIPGCEKDKPKFCCRAALFWTGSIHLGVPLRWGALRCKSKFWAQNFKFWARDLHPPHCSLNHRGKNTKWIRVVVGDVHYLSGLIEFLRGRPRGGDKFTSLFKCSRPFIQSVKSTFSHLKSCNPIGGTPSSTAWRPKSKPAGREKPIRVAAIRVVTKFRKIPAPIKLKSALPPPKKKTKIHPTP